ncbi:MAG: nitrous oxide reductase accessory protein NosL [bacterium]
MKRGMVLLLMLLLATTVTTKAFCVEAPARCLQCSMDRTTFDYSRMLIEHTDGTTAGFCSLHCVVEYTKQNPSKAITAIKVADYNTKELIDAKKAVWVVGGKVHGVMTFLPKWAFTSKADAKAFIKKNGGKLSTFDKVWKMTEEELAKKHK